MTRRFGSVPATIRPKLEGLSISDLDSLLDEALSVSDLDTFDHSLTVVSKN
ncbi:MAG: DUF4351 domain-containing protein [Chloroflexi bacterium]|nr:DUF4351 domain-containing protein [Chloroflexota bacterium]